MATCEKNSFANGPEKRICAREDCGERVVGNPSKLYCTERCRRVAEKRRYRLHHWETAVCKGCGQEFERTTSSKRKQLYCSLKCQADSRSAEYAGRPDIRANAVRAAAIQAERRREVA